MSEFLPRLLNSSFKYKFKFDFLTNLTRRSSFSAMKLSNMMVNWHIICYKMHFYLKKVIWKIDLDCLFNVATLRSMFSH